MFVSLYSPAHVQQTQYTRAHIHTQGKTTLELCGKLKGKFFAVDSPGDLMQLCQRKPVAYHTYVPMQTICVHVFAFNTSAYTSAHAFMNTYVTMYR